MQIIMDSEHIACIYKKQMPPPPTAPTSYNNINPSLMCQGDGKVSEDAMKHGTGHPDNIHLMYGKFCCA